MKPAGKLLVPASMALLLTLAFASCTTLNEGTVVAKRFRPADPGFQSLGAAYTVELAGTAANGNTARRTVLVSEEEWSRLEVGDHFSVSQRGPTGPSVLRTLASGGSRRKSRHPAPAEPAPAAAGKDDGMLSRITNIFKPHPGEESGSARDKARAQTKKKRSAAAQASAPKNKPAAKAGGSPTAKPTATASPSPASRPAATASPSAATPAPAPRKELSYDEAATRAAEDARVRQLKQKIHAAQSDEDQHKAANDYFKAYYGRMRELAPAAKDRIDKEEASKLQ